MKMDQLFCFQQAVKYRSISVAAEKNYISQSSLSASISKLEKELGVNLLKRSNTGVEPTEFGMLVLEKAEIIFQAKNEILEASENIKSIGTVTVNSIPGIYYRILPEILERLQKMQSGIMLSVTTNESREIAQNISAGYSDFGIVIYGTYMELFKGLRYTPLFEDEYQLYVGKKSPLWNKKTVTYEDVCQQRYIAFRNEFRKNYGGLSEMFQKNDAPNVAFQTDDLDSMKRMIAEYDYVAFFPKFMWAGDFYLEHGLIRAIPINNRDMSFEVGYLESKKYKLSSLDKAVIEELKKTVIKLLDQEETS